MAKPPPDDEAAPALDQISTRWPLLGDAAQFVLRYAPAIRKYLRALLRDADDAEEVAQEFLVKGLLRGFVRTTHLQGRFRNYLKTAVRNAALNYLQRQRGARRADLDPDRLAAPEEPSSPDDQAWLAEWRRCALQRAWEALDSHQRQARGSLCYTVLRLAVDHQDEDSTALAARAAEQTGRPLRPDAFRKQLSRARRLFAEFLLAEVTQTLEEPTPDRVQEELVETGLMPYVRDFLPPEWGAPKPGQP
jgi:RNA polymerase sigma-70 factor (ECF subfamily)